MTVRIRLRGWFAILTLPACFSVCGAQNPVVPGSDAIVGYAYTADPHGLAQRSAQMVSRYSPGAQSTALTQLIGMTMGDAELRTARAGQPTLWVFLRGPEGSLVRVLAVSRAGADPDRLSLKARQMGMESRPLTDLVLVGAARALAQAEGLAPQIKSLLEAIHPADVSIYVLSDLWREQLAQAVQSGRAGTFGQALGAQPRTTPPASPSLAAGSGLPADPGALPFPALTTLEILRQIRMLHVMVNVKEDAVRIAVNLQAEDGSGLARFCSQAALPEPGATTGADAVANPMSAFLPESDSLRLTAYLGEEGPARLVTEAVESVAEQVQMPVEERNRLVAAAQQALPYKGLCGLSVLANGSYLALVTPVEPEKAIESLRHGLETHLRQGLSVPPPGASSSAASPGGALLPPPPGSSSPEGAPSERGVVLNEESGKPEIYEGFAIHRFSEKSAAAPSVGTKPLLAASHVGAYLVFSPSESEIKGAISRLLMLIPFHPPLKAYAEFVAGGNLYADFRLDASPGASETATQRAPIKVMGRTGEGRAQFAVTIPAATFARLAALNPYAGSGAGGTGGALSGSPQAP